MNERFEVKGGYIGLFEWILNINRKQSWTTFLPRDLFEEDSITYDSAVQTLANTPLLAPCYYIVGGPQPLQGAVITRDRDVAADIWRLGSDANSTWFLAQTNYDHWKAPLFIDDRVTPAYKCMHQMTQQKSSFAGIFNVLSTKPVLNKLTVYTSLIDVKTGHIETYTQYCGDPCWPF
jgi:acid ceramidase